MHGEEREGLVDLIQSWNKAAFAHTVEEYDIRYEDSWK